MNTNTGNTENTENSEITQIAAKVGEGVFQKYVIPRVDIQLEASKVTGITYSHSTNIIYVHGEKVEAISIQKALLDFVEFVLNACNLLMELLLPVKSLNQNYKKYYNRNYELCYLPVSQIFTCLPPTARVQQIII